MRIFHSSTRRQNALNELLVHEESIERTYVPQSLVDAEKMTYTPTLVNYIFVHTSLKSLKEIKADKTRYEHLRFVMNTGCDERYNPTSEIAYVPDKQMEDFIRVTESRNEHVLMIENLDFAFKPGQKVRITQGAFEGVEGTLKSIKKHIAVVIPIKNIMAVAIINVPKKHLQRLDNEPI